MTNRFIKKVKLELFLLYKLFNPKYTPVCAGDFKCYLNYFKNRFFSGSLFEKINGFKFEGDDGFEIHVLCQKSDIWMMAWSLYSFLYFSGLKPSAVIIHDDGSLEDTDMNTLMSKFSNLRVMSRSDADNKVAGLLNNEKARRYRKEGHSLILKLVDIFVLSSAPKVMILDSDVLFFNKPEEIIKFIKGMSGSDALISGLPEVFDKFKILVNDEYLRRNGLIGSKIEFMNSGIILYNKSALSLDMLYQYFDNCLREYGDYFVEMTGWNCLIGQLKYNFLPVNKYIIKGEVAETTVAKHYTSGRRQELYAHGVDLVRLKIKNGK